MQRGKNVRTYNLDIDRKSQLNTNTWQQKVHLKPWLHCWADEGEGRHGYRNSVEVQWMTWSMDSEETWTASRAADRAGRTDSVNKNTILGGTKLWGWHCAASWYSQAWVTSVLQPYSPSPSSQHLKTSLLQTNMIIVPQVTKKLREHLTMKEDKKLIRRWYSERELSLRRHRTRTTKYNRFVHKFRQRSTQRLFFGTYFYQIQWNNAM